MSLYAPTARDGTRVHWHDGGRIPFLQTVTISVTVTLADQVRRPPAAACRAITIPDNDHVGTSSTSSTRPRTRRIRTLWTDPYSEHYGNTYDTDWPSDWTCAKGQHPTVPRVTGQRRGQPGTGYGKGFLPHDSSGLPQASCDGWRVTVHATLTRDELHTVLQALEHS